MSEERARNMGWVPKEEFKGDPEKWVDHDIFLDRGDNIMPILKERMGALEGKFEAQTAELAKTRKSLEKFVTYHKGTKKRMYEKAFKDLESQKRAAVEAGDAPAYDVLVQKEMQIVEEVQSLEDEATKGDEESPLFPQFKVDNPWYGVDPEMTAYANALQPLVSAETSGDEEFFKVIAAKTVKRFPEKVRAPAVVAQVEGADAGGGASEKTGSKGWADLPQDAKDAYNLEFSDIPNFTKENYAKDYFAQE